MMRYQGKITKWVDDKGFGFITQDGSNEQVFVHISGFEKGQQRPNIGEAVSYEVANDVKKGLQAYKIQYTNRPAKQARPHKNAYKSKNGVNLFKWISVVVLLMISLFLYKKAPLPSFQKIYEQLVAELRSMKAQQSIPAYNSQSFQCGKTHCGEMTSCEEATFYLNNCPGTIADGDGDGIPCEDQWCGH